MSCDVGTAAVEVRPHCKFSPTPHDLAKLANCFGEYPALHTHASKLILKTPNVIVFTGQFVQLESPVVVLYVFGAQSWHTPPSGPVNPALQTQFPMETLAEGELVFPGHAEHVAEVLAPITAEYVPAPQSVHATLPLLVLYFPATHAVHTPPLGPDDPALQEQPAIAELDAAEVEFTGHTIQTDETVAPTVVEYVPPGQLEQTPDPVTSLYLPATQPEQTPPFGPVNPALQVQAALAELETGAFAFEGHARQVDEALAPTVTEYVVVPQSVHAALPALVLYFPATHRTHAPGGPVLPAEH